PPSRTGGAHRHRRPPRTRSATPAPMRSPRSTEPARQPAPPSSDNASLQSCGSPRGQYRSNATNDELDAASELEMHHTVSGSSAHQFEPVHVGASFREEARPAAQQDWHHM